MKVTEVMYSGLGAKQFAYDFNSKNNTNINITSEIIEGATFVTIDFKDYSKEIIFKFSYELGKIQKRLMKSGEIILPLDEYPFPPTEE